jgi:Asp-tRNA(Asn)/Glu-tRNA(Gln) amidotransferase A subunit family amidase
VADRIVDASLTELAASIRAGEISSLETVSAFLERIHQLDPGIAAWAWVNTEGAMKSAERCDQHLAERKPLGPLHGVPIGFKDIFETQGIPTGMGSPIFDGYIPDHDAETVRLLKEAGAIVLGKLATSEFATLDPSPTRNPWNPAHTPGGSSSGSAAAVAARMCPAATGTQTAGSIGRPAAFCGVTGLMPTADRIPRDGVFPAAWSLDHVGAFGRSVDDVALMVEAMSGDSLAAATPSEHLKFGLVRGFFEANTSDAAWERHEAFTDSLEDRGYETAPLALPEAFETALPSLWTIMKCEVAAAHRERYAAHADMYGTRIREFVEEGLQIPATDYVRALAMRQAFKQEMLGLFEHCNIILSSGAPGPAPLGLETTGDPILSAPWTFADFPTLSIPLGLDSTGLPIGIQLSARPLGEPALITAGRRIERTIPRLNAPPNYG